VLADSVSAEQIGLNLDHSVGVLNEIVSLSSKVIMISKQLMRSCHPNYVELIKVYLVEDDFYSSVETIRVLYNYLHNLFQTWTKQISSLQESSYLASLMSNSELRLLDKAVFKFISDPAQFHFETLRPLLYSILPIYSCENAIDLESLRAVKNYL
jgi:hypothetical protein